MILVKDFMMFTSIFSFLVFLTWWVWVSYSTPVPFINPHGSLFENTTLVDFHNGSMDGVLLWLRQHPVTLVMFYTAWSGQCVKVAPEVLDAHLMIDNPHVSIVSVNCWVGQCREVFHSLYFPRLFLYHTDHVPIEYLDDIKAHKILDFIQLSIRPFQYIGSEEVLRTFLTNYDSNVIAYMDPTKMQQNKKFNVFIATSVHLVNRVNAPRIGVILQKGLAHSVGLFVHGNVSLNSYFFSTKYYSNSANYTKDDLIYWIVRNSRKLVNHLTPNATDNLHYIHQLTEASLILAVPFTGVNPELLIEFYKVALEYYDCHCLKDDQLPESSIGKTTHTTECPLSLSHYGHTYTANTNCLVDTQGCWNVRSLHTVVMDDLFQCVLFEDSNSTWACSTMRTPRDRSYGYTHSMCCHRPLPPVTNNGSRNLSKDSGTRNNKLQEDSIIRKADIASKVDTERSGKIENSGGVSIKMDTVNDNSKVDIERSSEKENSGGINNNKVDVDGSNSKQDTHSDQILTENPTTVENSMSIANKLRDLVDAHPWLMERSSGSSTAPKDDDLKMVEQLLLDSLSGGDKIDDAETKKSLLQFFATDGSRRGSIDADDDIDASIQLMKALQGDLHGTDAGKTSPTAEAPAATKKTPESEEINRATISLLPTPISVEKSFSESTQSLCGKNAPCCSRDLNSTRSSLPLADFPGLACQTNKTLNFYLLDNTRYKYLLENAGINTGQPSLLLVDLEAKTHFSMKDNINYLSIVHFILKFTLGQLVRDYISLHKTSYNPLRRGVVELTTDSFHEEIYGNQKHVLVMFYTPWCGVCKPANLMFLRLMKKYEKQHNLKFARIDNDRNELPWQYTASSYPSFVLFPANRKDVSIAYPDDLEITVENFVHFLDSRLQQ